MTRLIRAIAMLLVAVLYPAVAQAQNYTVSSVTTADFGNIVSAASGATVYRAAASSGSVTKVSGSGARLSTASVRSLVTVSCSGGGNACNTANVQLQITTTGTPTGRALSLQNFTVSTSGATATITVAPGTGNTISFRLGPIGRNSSKTFWVGFDYHEAGNGSSGATGTANAAFTVTASRISGSGSSTLAGTATARVLRPISITATRDLAFGRVVLPRTGSGTLGLSAAGVLSVTGNGTTALTSTRTTAAFTVSGEGGQSVTVSVPATVSLTGPGGTITVNTLSSGAGAQVLGGALGSSGTLGVTVGGTVPLTSTTASGTYTGTLSVTVQYN